MKKIEVDQNKCIGCGACVGLTNSEIFDFNDDGLASAIENNFDELNEEKKENFAQNGASPLGEGFILLLLKT